MRLSASRMLAAVPLLAAALGHPTSAFAQAPTVAVAPAAVERLPEWKDGDGLVVGQLAGTWDFGFATMGGEALQTSLGVKGGGGRVRDGLYRGVVLFTRGEGNVTLAAARVEIGGMFQTLSIARKFSTAPGQVTVLGLMYFQKDAGTREGYRILAFDNKDETIDYLRRTYPQLLAGHDAAQVVLAPGDYLPMEKLVELRMAYAAREAREAKRQGRFWVAAPAGTIAEVEVAGSDVKVLRFLPPVTYHEPVMNSWDERGMLTFSSMTHRWRVLNGTVEELPPEREAKENAGR